MTSHTELLCCLNTKHNCKSKAVKGESEDTAAPTACLYVEKAVAYAGNNSLSQVIIIRLKDKLEPELQCVNT